MEFRSHLIFERIYLFKKADLSGTHGYLLGIKDLLFGLPSTFNDVRERKRGIEGSLDFLSQASLERGESTLQDL